MTVVKDLFSEKFRPKTLGELIAPPRIKKSFEKGLINNVLLHGTAGTGKTSTLFILSKDHTTKYINASTEGRIDVIRNEIEEFCTTISLMDSGKDALKCVILDEMDGSSDEFFKALRAVMERYSGVARFIASCNYIAKIPAAIQSRFTCISYDPINQKEEEYLTGEYKTRLELILKAAHIEYHSDILDKFVRNDFPDMRTLLNKVQNFYNQGIKILDPANFNINYDYKDLFDLCINGGEKAYENYKLVSGSYASRVDEALAVLGTDFPEYLEKIAPDKMGKLPAIIIAVAQYQYEVSFAIDKIVTLLALVYKIQTILKQ